VEEAYALHTLHCAWIDLFVVGAHFVVVEIGQVEEMPALSYCARLACAGLVQQEGLFALQDALVLMVLNLQKNKIDFGVVFFPSAGISHLHRRWFAS